MRILERRFIKKNCELHERLFDKRKNAGKELNFLVTQVCFCKVFPITPKCAYNLFYNNAHNILVQLFDASKVKEDDPRTYYDIFPVDDRKILFKNVTICKRKDLDKEENTLEYFHVPKY